MKRTPDKPVNTNNTPHLVADDLIRAIEVHLAQKGVKVEFDDDGHSLIEGFVDQYNTECSHYYDEAARSDIQNQELRKALRRIISAFMLFASHNPAEALSEAWADWHEGFPAYEHLSQEVAKALTLVATGEDRKDHLPTERDNA